MGFDLRDYRSDVSMADPVFALECEKPRTVKSGFEHELLLHNLVDANGTGKNAGTGVWDSQKFE